MLAEIIKDKVVLSLKQDLIIVYLIIIYTMQIGGDLLLYICGGILSKILNEFTPEKAIKH